ncbi:MAG: hypothetical protein CR986_00960 [Ignavibacteriae bacterium]|nr:MAG: hypothetical protein CR986_00960 [Ignavibacteriota bacterium]
MKLKHKIEFYLFFFLGKLFTSFGYGILKKSSNFLAFLFFRILKIRRKVVSKNLSIAFPNLTLEELNQLSYKTYKNSALTFLELFYYYGKKEELLSIINVENINLLHKNIKKQNGLILLTGHLGNWELGAVVAGAKMNKPLNVLVKKQKNSYVAKWLTKFREQLNNKEILLGLSIREIYKTIKSNGAVGIVGDQRAQKKDGIKVNFFAKTTYTFHGTANIALKTQCPVLVVFCTREKNGTYNCHVRELDYSKFNGTHEEKIVQFNQMYMSYLEETIKKYPEQWFWMHNIWKY